MARNQQHLQLKPRNPISVRETECQEHRSPPRTYYLSCSILRYPTKEQKQSKRRKRISRNERRARPLKLQYVVSSSSSQDAESGEGSPRRYVHSKNLPIICTDGNPPFVVMAKEAEARFIGYLCVSCVSCMSDSALKILPAAFTLTTGLDLQVHSWSWGTWHRHSFISSCTHEHNRHNR